MQSFLQFANETKSFTAGASSLWCIGTTSEQFDRKSGKFVKDNSFAWPMYMTRSITSAISYAKSKKVQKRAGGIRIVVVGKVLKPDIKVFDLEDSSDFMQSSFKPQMAELFKLADPYFSFTTQDSLRMRKSYVPKSIFTVHTIAKNFIRWTIGKLATKHGSRLSNEGWAKLLSRPLQTMPISKESYIAFRAEYCKVRDQFNATHPAKKHMAQIPEDLEESLEKHVNAYISGFQTVNELVVGDSSFMAEFGQIPTYIDILQYALFKDIFQRGFDGYHIAEFAKVTSEKAACMALFSAGIFEPIAAMHATSAEEAFDRSDVRYGAEQNDNAVKSVLKQVEPNYIDWY